MKTALHTPTQPNYHNVVLALQQLKDAMRNLIQSLESAINHTQETQPEKEIEINNRVTPQDCGNVIRADNTIRHLLKADTNLNVSDLRMAIEQQIAACRELSQKVPNPSHAQSLIALSHTLQQSLLGLYDGAGMSI